MGNSGGGDFKEGKEGIILAIWGLPSINDDSSKLESKCLHFGKRKMECDSMGSNPDLILFEEFPTFESQIICPEIRERAFLI